jgi:hypothetical protein
MNKKAARTLQSIERDVQEAFGVRLSEVLGGSIHRFHKDPKRVERILQTPGHLPHDAAFSFGAVTLDTHINSFPAPDGSLAGYVVGWEDISEKHASEARPRRSPTDGGDPRGERGDADRRQRDRGDGDGGPRHRAQRRRGDHHGAVGGERRGIGQPDDE